MKKEEAFTLHMLSLVNDLINTDIGFLRKHEGLSEVDQSIKILETKRDRITSDAIIFLGGLKKYKELSLENVKSGYNIEADDWK